MNKLLPLGLPEGSVRGLLAILLTLTVCGLAVFGRPIPEALAAGWGLAMGSYFQYRAQGSGDANTTVKGDAEVNVHVDTDEAAAVARSPPTAP